MTGLRRLSHAISEGEGISVLVVVGDRESARSAALMGAKGLAVTGGRVGVREATQLPLLWSGADNLREASGAGADAVVLAAERAGDSLEELFEEAHELGLECVLKVRDEEELEDVLDRVDPEILLLSAAEDDDAEPHLERLLDLLPDVPAGKLAIADLPGASRHDIAELERAGVDAVLVSAGDVGRLVDDRPPEV